MKITKDTMLIDALKMGNTQAMAEVLYGFGMHCLGCILANNETVGEAAAAHNIDEDKMIKALNEACDKKQSTLEHGAMVAQRTLTPLM